MCFVSFVWVQTFWDNILRIIRVKKYDKNKSLLQYNWDDKILFKHITIYVLKTRNWCSSGS